MGVAAATSRGAQARTEVSEGWGREFSLFGNDKYFIIIIIIMFLSDTRSIVVYMKLISLGV